MNAASRTAGKARLIKGLLLGAAVVLLGYEAFASAMTNVLHRTKPELALRFTSDDPVALATAGQQLLLAGKAVKDTGHMLRLGQRSTEGLAVNPTALGVIGYSRSMASYVPGRQAMELAHQMNRSNLPVHLWLIEAAVARNDAAEALRHYDLAMRTNMEARQILSPVLTAALEDKTLWPPFLKIVQQQPEWLPDFFRFAVRTTTKPTMVAELMEAVRGRYKSPVDAAVRSELLKRLGDEGAIPAALRLYVSLPDARPEVPASLSFSDPGIDPRYPPLTWTTYNSEGAASGFLRSQHPSENELHINFYEPGTFQAAAKMIVARAGRYRLRAVQHLAEGSSGGQLTWELMCRTGQDQKILWSKRVDLTANPSLLDAELDLPAGCDSYLFRMVGRTDQLGSEMVVQQPRLDRIG